MNEPTPVALTLGCGPRPWRTVTLGRPAPARQQKPPVVNEPAPVAR